MNFCMLRFLKQVVWLGMVAVLILSGRSARAFSPAGPIGNGTDAYQTLELGYNIPGLDLTAPKSIGQEFRRTTPVMYYAADNGFLQFFGIEGVKALDNAFAILNEVTNVDLYTSNLVEFPLQAQRVNQRAASLSLFDLKSVTLGLMTEQLGLFQPARAVWVLRNRVLPAGAPPCPVGEEYNVIPRNIDILTSPLSKFQYTSYVNGVLYSYFIYENCGMGSPPLPVADAEEFSVDPDAQPYTAVADYLSQWYHGYQVGGFYTELTRDDVGGLRYLLDTNNYNFESSGPGTVQFTTNPPALITNLDLGLFSAQALTNGPAALTALYPGLVIISSTNTFGLQITTNTTETFVNSPTDPVGTPPSIPHFTTSFTTNPVSFFQYTFGNVITNSFSTLGLVGTVGLSLSNSPTAPFVNPSTVVTNAKFSFVHGTFGTFFLLPANLCSIQIITNLLTQVIATTNPPTIISNTPAGTTGNTNVTVTFTPGTITFFTNSIFVYLPVTCPADTSATRQGVGQLTFLRRDFDSLVNQFWDPVTNTYTLYALTNGFIVPQQIQRVVTAPDFLFDAADIGLVIDSPNVFNRNVPFDTVDTPATSAGPGTIDGPSTITFQTLAPIFVITGGGSIGSAQSVQLVWGSFDGTTNDPIVYPNGTSIAELESQLLGPFIVTTSLPNGNIGVAYSATLTGTGGQPPYTWSLPTNSALPSGLTLSTNGIVTGTPTGPVATYDVSITITDSASNSNNVPFTLTIDP